MNNQDTNSLNTITNKKLETLKDYERILLKLLYKSEGRITLSDCAEVSSLSEEELLVIEANALRKLIR